MGKVVVGCAAAALVLSAAGGCEKKTEIANAAIALAPQIVRSAATQPSKRIDLPALTEFAWERVYIFAPYTSPEEITEALGFNWGGVTRTKISSSDSISLLVFVKDQKVVGWTECPRVDADFSYVSSTKGYTPAEAKFSINDEKAWPMVAQTRPEAPATEE